MTLGYDSRVGADCLESEIALLRRSTGGIVFTTEGIENIPAGWRAREIYKILGADEFVEVFELAKPGKDFELYSEGHYRRKK
jgi:hypothetical protein